MAVDKTTRAPIGIETLHRSAASAGARDDGVLPLRTMAVDVLAGVPLRVESLEARSASARALDDRVSDLGVVPGYEPTRSAVRIVHWERRSASAGARGDLVGLVRQHPVARALPVQVPVLGNRGDDLEVVGPIVQFVAVQVMHDFGFIERPTELGFGNKPVLVNVASRISEAMFGKTNQNVAVRCD